MMENPPSLNLQFHQAITKGDCQTVQQFLTSGIDVNHLLDLRGTPLCAAITSKQSAIVNLLLEAGCDANAKDYDGEPPLCVAIRRGNMDIVKSLLDHPQCDLNMIDPVSKNTPLIVAIEQNYCEYVSPLVTAGCDINKPNKKGDPPLIFAVRKRNYDVMHQLLEGGASLLCSDYSGYNVLHVATQEQDFTAVNALLHHLDSSQTDNNLRLEDTLCDSHNITGDTVLHIAAKNNLPHIVSLFLSVGSKNYIDKLNNERCSAFFIGCMDNFEQVVEVLLENGADPNLMGSRRKVFHVSTSTRSMTPLHCVVLNNNMYLVQKLLLSGASLNIADSGGETPFLCSLLRDRTEITKYFLDNGKDFNLAPSEHMSDGYTTLDAACTSDSPDVFITRLVLEYGCHVNVYNSHGQTALHIGAESDCVEAVKILLNLGADSECCDSRGHTALGVCAIYGSENWSSLITLIEYGANIDTPEQGVSDNAPLRLALEHENYDVAFYLIQCGCCLNVLMGHVCDPKVLSRLGVTSPQPISLMHLCRKLIRSHLRTNHRLPHHIFHLPLPGALIDFLLYRDRETVSSSHVTISLSDTSSSSDASDTNIPNAL